MRSSIASLALVAISFSTLGPAIAQDPVKTDSARQERADIRRQIENLASPDFEVRKGAAKKLEAYGKKARALLKETVEQSDDAEQVWQARRLLRRTEGRRSGLKSGAEPKGKSQSGLKPAPRAPARSGQRSKSGQGSQNGQSRRGVVRGFGIDMRGFPGYNQGESPEEFARRIQEFLRKQAKALPEARGGAGLPGRQHDQHSEAEGTEIRVGPDGVEVEITVTKDGKADRKRYKAKSMQELLAKHPELKGKVSGFSIQRGSRFGFGTPGIRGFGHSPMGGEEMKDLERQIESMEKHLKELMGRDFPRGLPGVRSKSQDPHVPGKKGPAAGPGTLKPLPSGGPKLGIYVGDEDTGTIARFLGLPEGVGLAVAGCTEDSLATNLGLTKGDFLVKLDGVWIREAQDVAKVLSAKSKGQSLKAQWYRKGKKMQKSTRF